MTKAIGYVRSFEAVEGQETARVRTQEARIRAAAVVYEVELVEIIQDQGVDGGDLDRPGLEELVALVRGGHVGVILVTKLDRLSEKIGDLIFLLEEVFIPAEIRLISLSEPLDTANVLGRFFVDQLGELVRVERELHGHQISEALAEKKARGEWLGSTPYGFRTADDGERVPLLRELATVEKIFSWRRQGRTYGWIADRLHQLGVSTKRGGDWHAGTVHYIHTNPIYDEVLER